MNAERLSSSSTKTHETIAMLELIEIIETAERVINWLVESGPGADPAVRAMQRARLNSLYAQLGIDPDDPNAMHTLLQFRREIDHRANHPQPHVDIPEVSFFEEKITQLRSDQMGNLPIERGPQISTESMIDLADIALFGYTNWNDVQSRTSARTDGEYIHGIAMIMSDPIAYHKTFLSREIVGMDSPAVDTRWRIQNGRHRSLAARCLGVGFVLDSGMHTWIPVTIEP
jgi:hypothetical protein